MQKKAITCETVQSCQRRVITILWHGIGGGLPRCSGRVVSEVLPQHLPASSSRPSFLEVAAGGPDCVGDNLVQSSVGAPSIAQGDETERPPLKHGC